MKIQVNDEIVLEINETNEKVIKDYINSDIFDSDMKRRICWTIQQIYEESFRIFKSKWDIKLLDLGIMSIPTDPDAYAELVFSQADYKNKKQRDLEENLPPIIG